LYRTRHLVGYRLAERSLLRQLTHQRVLAVFQPRVRLRPLVAGYVEQLGTAVSKPTVKQHLAAIRMLLDWLVTGQVIPINPAHAVRGPWYSVKKDKTSVLSAEEMRTCSIPYLCKAKAVNRSR